MSAAADLCPPQAGDPAGSAVHRPSRAGERHFRRPGTEASEEEDGSGAGGGSAAAAATRPAGPGAPQPAAGTEAREAASLQKCENGMPGMHPAEVDAEGGSLRGRDDSEGGEHRQRSSRSQSRSRSRSRQHRRSPPRRQHSRSKSHSRSRSRSRSRSGRRSKSRSLSAGNEGERRHHRSSHHRQDKQDKQRGRSRSREHSRERREQHEQGGERREKGHRHHSKSHSTRHNHSHSHSHHGQHRRNKNGDSHHHHRQEDEAEDRHHLHRTHSHQRKRSRSPEAPPQARGGSSHERAQPQQQRQQHGAAQPDLLQQASRGSEEASPAPSEGVLRRDSSFGSGAASLLKLSLRQHSMPSPATAAAAEALLPRAAAGQQQQQQAWAAPRLAAPSPAGPSGLLRVHTPSAAALAAAQGVDLADVALVQPSPMAAEATVAALSALMRQPARQPSLQGRPRGGGGAAPGNKQLLSFGDEMEEEESDGAGARLSGGLSAATSKRFKHEKTLVMLNPLLTGTPFADEEELPMSPAAPPDKRLGHVLWGSAQAKGMRPYMEDRHTIINSFQPRTSMGQLVQDGVFRAYAAVFDGHNGASAAEHVADRLHHVLAAEHAMRTCTGEGPPATALQEEERLAAALVHSFESVDREIMNRCRTEGTKGGATGLVVLRIGNQLYAAHCGDTRAVMQRNGEALRLTEDHKPNLPRERKRVEGLGGRVDFARCWRVIVEPGDGRPASGLAVSRSFGDPDFKEPLHLVTATPDVIRERLQPGDEFVILASDGLWDVMSDTDACTVVRRHLQQSGAPRQITPPQLMPGAAAFGGGAFAEQMRRPVVLTPALATAAAERLVQESLDRGTMDNVTAIVGLLQWD